MTDDERQRWAGVCVIFTGLITTQAALLRDDQPSARAAFRTTLETMDTWAKALQTAVGSDEGTKP